MFIYYFIFTRLLHFYYINNMPMLCAINNNSNLKRFIFFKTNTIY